MENNEYVHENEFEECRLCSGLVAFCLIPPTHYAERHVDIMQESVLLIYCDHALGKQDFTQ